MTDQQSAAPASTPVTMETESPTPGISGGETPSQAKVNCPGRSYGFRPGPFPHMGWYGYGHHQRRHRAERKDESAKTDTADGETSHPECPLKDFGLHGLGHPRWRHRAFMRRLNKSGHPYRCPGSDGDDKTQTSDCDDSDEEIYPPGLYRSHGFMGPPPFGAKGPYSHWAARMRDMHHEPEDFPCRGSHFGKHGPHWGFGGRWAHDGHQGPHWGIGGHWNHGGQARCGHPFRAGMMGPRRKTITIVEAGDPFMGPFF